MAIRGLSFRRSIRHVARVFVYLSSLELVHSFPDIRLITPVGWAVIRLIDPQVILVHKSALIIMGVPVSLAVPQPLVAAVGGAAEVPRNRYRPALADVIDGLVDGDVRRVALGGGGHVDG